MVASRRELSLSASVSRADDKSMVYLKCEYYILPAALASLQLLEGAEPEGVARLVELLDYLDREVICGTSFEFLQALLRATILVHGEAIMQVRWCLAISCDDILVAAAESSV